MFVIFNYMLNQFAATDRDWNVISETTLYFDTYEEADEFRSEFIWEKSVQIIELN